MENGVCKEPTEFYLMGVALRSFFWVLATHLLAGEVDTTLAGVPLLRRMSWWFRYYNPLNLSWRYYSMFAYRFTAQSWGTTQLALINHEEHPLMPPLPYIIGETVHPLHIRRLEMAGLLSSQGILTFSAAYQGALAIQYAISTEGIPYLPNTTVPLAIVGLFRVMASKWVASKIHVDSYPYPCTPATSSSQAACKSNAGTFSCFLHKCKSSIGALWASSPIPKDTSTAAVVWREPPLLASSPVTRLHIDSPSILSAVPGARNIRPSSVSTPAKKLHIDRSSSPSVSTLNIHSMPPSSFIDESGSLPSLRLPYSQLPPLVLPLSFEAAYPRSPTVYSPSVLRSPNSPLLPTISHPFSHISSSMQAKELKPPISVGACDTGALPSQFSSNHSSSTSQQLSLRSCSSSELNHADAHSEIPCIEQQLPYKSNKLVVGGWMGVLVGLVTLSFLPYKVVPAYQLPRTLLQFSMQIFYQYIAVSEFVFHAYLLHQGPRALANRVLFFDHWAFKAQTAGFFILLMFMLVVALLDFVKHEFYRSCA